MSIHPVAPGEFTQEFRVLFELSKLSDNRFDQKVSLSAVIKTCGLCQDEAEQIISSLRESGLLVFDAVIGFLRITRYGISEVVTAKASPHTRTAYFPSLIKMGIRLRRGHHLFDTVEPVWPIIQNRTGDSASEALNSAPLMPEQGQNDTEQFENKVAQTDGNPSDQQLLTTMINELEGLEKQLAVSEEPVSKDPFERLGVLIEHHYLANTTMAACAAGTNTEKLWTRSAAFNKAPAQSTSELVSELEHINELLFTFV